MSEAFDAAARAGSVGPLMRTLHDWIPGIDWEDFVSYHLDRIRKHGKRRAAELDECAAFLRDLGVSAPTTEGASVRHESQAGTDTPL